MVAESNQLSLLSKARMAVEQARTIDEVKDVRDKAEAIRAYLRQSGESLEIQNAAAEIKIRAERKGGVLLAMMTKPKNQHQCRLHDVTSIKEIGIEKIQSHRWQRIASIPETMFEQHVESLKVSGDELTTSSVLTLAKSLTKAKRKADVAENVAESTEDLGELVAGGKKFACIYADPPWQYGNQATRASTDNHYPTMTVDEIAALPIGQVAADNAHLHLWTTNAFLFDCQQIMEAWGFTYKSVFVWVKPQMGIGNYWRVSHEFLLLGTRGSCPFLSKSEMSWKEIARTTHSTKPEEIRKMIERVSPGPRLEMFGRRLADGWTVWGNQISRTMFDPEAA